MHGGAGGQDARRVHRASGKSEDCRTRRPERRARRLYEQRRFVLWWDEQEKQAGSLKRGQTPASPVNDAGATPLQTTDAVKAEDYGLDRDTIHRWRPFLGRQNRRNESIMKVPAGFFLLWRKIITRNSPSDERKAAVTLALLSNN